MALNFTTDLPEDVVRARSGNVEIARQLKENPTATGWADITKDGGYSKRATATAAAKAINDHTHKEYRDYGFEATVRSIPVQDADGAQVYETDEKTGKKLPKQLHFVYARYNNTLPNAGTLAPETPKKPRKVKAPESAPAPVSEPASTGADQESAAVATVPETPVSAPTAPTRARARAAK